MPKVTEAIQSFLNAQAKSHNAPDLLGRWTPFMETQVNVAAGEGEPVAGRPSTYTDGVDEWHHIRIPRHAKTEPEFRDYELRWPLDLHVEAIGSTGWDWSARKSRWVGFDFDAITGHAAGVGVSDDELQKIKEIAQALPYVEVRRSTGGKGLHLYVYLDGITTENHDVHAALARCVLGMMSSEAGFDFASQIDVCGGNMWIWHRKSTPTNGGLMLLKPSEKSLTATDLPKNWRDHIEVITRQRSKIRVRGVSDEELDPFEALASSRKIIPLDSQHKRLIEQLHGSGFSTIWVSDHHLLQTHTAALQSLADGCVGFFQTNSEGRDPGTPNCFLFPLPNGAWKVYRFSQGINEADTWEQDGEGWTTCYFNRAPDLKVAAKATGGIEDPEKSGFVFDTARSALEAARAVGQEIDIPEKLLGRETRLKAHKDGRLVACIQKREGDTGMSGWLPKKTEWVRVFETRTEQKNDELGFAEYDNILRALSTPTGDRAGWACRVHGGDWDRVPKDDVKSALLGLGNTKAEADVILGTAVLKSWRLVSLPFQSEYPGGRQWNRDAAQYRYAPAELADGEAPHHPHWDLILRHCFGDLDAPLRASEWAQRNNIRSGRDYGLAWIACMLRDPFAPLPYLFLHGPQNSGKSILHEAIGLLVTKGVASADRALTNNNDFNGELAGAILAVIEEKNVAKSKGSYDKIKDWVTSPTLWVRRMRTDSYSQANSLHFIQVSNERDACPIFAGDTRITMCFVPEIEDEIPKKVLMDRLREEAPAFMASVMGMDLPSIEGRLRLPVIATYSKQRAEELSRDALQQFLDEHCHYTPGAIVLFSDLFEKFYSWLQPEDQGYWTRKKVTRHLPDIYPTGRHTANKLSVGNMSFQEDEQIKDDTPWTAVSGYLRREQNG